MPELENLRHELFCQEYVRDFKLAAAAKRAGFTWSDDGKRLIAIPEIKARIKELSDERFSFIQMDAAEVLGRISAIARFDMKNLMDDRGNLKPIHELDDDTRAGLLEVDIYFDKSTQMDVKKYKGADKLGALKLLAQHFKLIGTEVNVSITTDLADKLERAAARRRQEIDVTPQPQMLEDVTLIREVPAAQVTPQPMAPEDDLL